jgi:hypothetical protein
VHADYLRAAIRDGLVHCNAIVLLPGWPRSRGALIELNAATGMRGMWRGWCLATWVGIAVPADAVVAVIAAPPPIMARAAALAAARLVMILFMTAPLGLGATAPLLQSYVACNPWGR